MNRLRQLRLERGLTMRELATELNYDHAAIGRIETNERSLHDEDIFKLVNFFNCSSDYLLGLSTEKKPLEVNSKDLEFYNRYVQLNSVQKDELATYLEFIIAKNK